MAIYELRTYDVVVGKMAEAIALYNTEGWPAIQRQLGWPSAHHVSI